MSDFSKAELDMLWDALFERKKQVDFNFNMPYHHFLDARIAWGKEAQALLNKLEKMQHAS